MRGDRSIMTAICFPCRLEEGRGGRKTAGKKREGFVPVRNFLCGKGEGDSWLRVLARSEERRKRRWPWWSPSEGPLRDGERTHTRCTQKRRREEHLTRHIMSSLPPLLSPSLARLLEREREAGERVNIVRGRITSEEGEEVSVFFPDGTKESEGRGENRG